MLIVASLVAGFVPQQLPHAARPRRARPCLSATAPSEELLELAALPDKSDALREQILALSERLEAAGEGKPYLSDPTLQGNYEVVYFDRSVDGGRDGGDTTSSGSEVPRSPRRPPKLLRQLFRMRGSFQHIVAADKLVNFVEVAACGIRARVVAEGTFAQLAPDEIAEIAASNGTRLTDQTVRITFGTPRLAVAGCCFELSGPSAQPPVDLCVTYLDDKLRLGTCALAPRSSSCPGQL